MLGILIGVLFISEVTDLKLHRVGLKQPEAANVCLENFMCSLISLTFILQQTPHDAIPKHKDTIKQF